MNIPIEIVTLDYLYENVENPLARDLFSKLLLLRKKGYGPDHPKFRLPYDMTDFIGRHHLFCIREETSQEPLAKKGHLNLIKNEKGQSLIPIGGMKHLSLKRCDFHKLKLPALDIVLGSNVHPHIEIVEKIINQHREQGQDLLYGGHFTIDKSFRGKEGQSEQIHELVAALSYQDLLESGADSLIGIGAVRFKADQLFEKIGYRKLTNTEQKPLELFNMQHLPNDPVVLIQMHEATQWAKECFKKHEKMLRSRIEIRAPIGAPGTIDSIIDPAKAA